MLLQVKRADTMAQSEYMRREKLDNLEQWKILYDRIIEEKQCVSLKTLAVTGTDLIAMGMKPGKEIGEMLHKLLDVVLENPEYNTKEQLLQKAKEYS